MPEAREVLRSATEKVRPDPGARERQAARQRRAARNRRLSAFATVAAIAAALALVFVFTRVSGSARPAHTPPSVGSPTHRMEPLVVGLDGTVQRRLPGIPVNARSLTVSPEGRIIAFVANNQIGTIGVDGSGLAQLTHLGPNTVLQGTPPREEFPEGLRGPLMPAWSPDGRRIAFTNGHLYVMNADGSGLTQLTSGQGIDLWPSWSSDGTTIVYSNSGSAPLDGSGFSHTQEIWTVPADGGTPTRLTHNHISDDMPAYSPDGARIAFVNGGGIMFMDPNGQHERPLRGLLGGVGNPRWSPDGSRIAFTQCCAGYSANDGRPLITVHIVDLKTGTSTEIPGIVESDVDSVQWFSNNALIENRYAG